MITQKKIQEIQAYYVCVFCPIPGYSSESKGLYFFLKNAIVEYLPNKFVERIKLFCFGRGKTSAYYLFFEE